MMRQYGTPKPHLRDNMTVTTESRSSEVELEGIARSSYRTLDESKTEVHTYA
jgi:hypothetical protein